LKLDDLVGPILDYRDVNGNAERIAGEAQLVSSQDLGRIRSTIQNLLGSSVATRIREMFSAQ